MSFRRKLTLFFVAIVMVPLIVVAVLLVRVTEDSRDGKADARVAAGLDVADSLYDEALRRALSDAERIAREAGPSLEASNAPALDALTDDSVAGRVLSVTIANGDGQVMAEQASGSPLAVAETEVSSGGEAVGTIRVGALPPRGYVRDINELTSLEVAVARNSKLVASTAEREVEVPTPGDESVTLELDDPESEFRAAALALRAAQPGTRVAIYVPREAGFAATQPLVAAVLAAILGVALLLIYLLLRNLQARVATMLVAARRIGNGDFDTEVPVEGNDEMAGLALEFNRMSDRLSRQMEQLHRQRHELDASVQRIGEAFASGLDRGALLEIMLETAIAACSADGGLVTIHDGPGDPVPLTAGTSSAALEPVLARSDLVARDRRGAGGESRGNRHAISYAMLDRADRERVICTLTVAREGDGFSRADREVLRYLIGQTQVSTENAGLHEKVARQAVTDELTGIPNHRHFAQWLDREVARVDRFGGELTLVIVDIDNFKTINDTYGHLRGDRVLEAIGKILLDQSREIDETARYGGEEFVLALPETPAEGGMEAAERLRVAIADASIAGDGGEAPIQITASLGVATMPADGDDSRSLIAAADAALYRAKRSGKNRVVSAGQDAVPAAQGFQGDRRS